MPSDFELALTEPARVARIRRGAVLLASAKFQMRTGTPAGRALWEKTAAW